MRRPWGGTSSPPGNDGKPSGTKMKNCGGGRVSPAISIQRGGRRAGGPIVGEDGLTKATANPPATGRPGRRGHLGGRRGKEGFTSGPWILRDDHARLHKHKACLAACRRSEGFSTSASSLHPGPRPTSADGYFHRRRRSLARRRSAPRDRRPRRCPRQGRQAQACAVRGCRSALPRRVSIAARLRDFVLSSLFIFAAAPTPAP